MRLTSRRRDDADVIRARLRALLATEPPGRGWVPEEDLVPDEGLGEPAAQPLPSAELPPEEEVPSLPEGIGRHRAPGAAVRWDPGRRGAWALCITGLVTALVLVAWTWFDRPQVTPAPGPVRSAGVSSTAPRTPAVGEAAATSPTVVVSIVGLVAQPGVLTLPTGSRVADAVAAAGGLLPQADPATVNLAAPLADGQQVAVGVPGTGAVAPGSGSPGSAAAAATGPVDLNTATVAQLDALPGIGPVLAQRIVDHRNQVGHFSSVDELDDVPGIGPALYARLVPQVRV